MSNDKKLVREQFRTAVFKRDQFRCRACGVTGLPLDAHHITDRNLLPAGGYVLENGISLCEDCHRKAEVFHQTGTSLPNFSPSDLYKKIGSSFEIARNACLQWVAQRRSVFRA